MSNSYLWGKTYWTAPINYITSTYIREYDISKANINILLGIGAIDQQTYNYLYRLPKMAREIMVGYMMADRKEEKLAQKVLQGIKEYRKLFFEANKIQDYSVLSIKNDAIYLIETIPSVTQFGMIEFKHKQTYTSFYKLDKKFNKELYYRLDMPNDIEILDINGLNDEAYKLHEPYMIDFLKALFSTIETVGLEEAIKLLQSFSDQYLNKTLPIGYYRRFDSKCGYDTIIRDTIGNMYNMKYLSEKDIGIIEIGYNYTILMNLYKYLAMMHFNKK